MMRFSNRLVAERVQPFWEALQAAEFLTDAAAAAGTHRWRGRNGCARRAAFGRAADAISKGAVCRLAEREEIALGRAGGESMRAIAARLGRSPSTISRELARNTCGAGYRATTAHALAYERASRPKPAKLAVNLVGLATSSAGAPRHVPPEHRHHDDGSGSGNHDREDVGAPGER